MYFVSHNSSVHLFILSIQSYSDVLCIWGAEACHSLHKETYRTGQTTTWINTFTPVGTLQFPVHRACMSADCGRKLRHLKETHRNTVRAFKLNTTASTGRGLQPRTSVLWINAANNWDIFAVIFLSFIAIHCSWIISQTTIHSYRIISYFRSLTCWSAALHGCLSGCALTRLEESSPIKEIHVLLRMRERERHLSSGRMCNGCVIAG